MPHITSFFVSGYRYSLTVQGAAAAGFDDIYITIAAVLDKSRWMEAAGDSVANVPLNQIRLPGSHDSGTSSITSDSPWEPDAEPWHVSKTIVAAWSKTQSRPIDQQLLDGIRYFDLRVAPAASGNGFAFVHALEGDPVTPALQAVRAFVETHNKEIVILDFNKFYSSTAFDHTALVKQIIDTLGPVLIPPSANVTVKPLQLWKGPGRVVVAYADDAEVAKRPAQLWPRQQAATSAISSPWPNTNDPEVLKTKLDEYLGSRAMWKFFVLQSILTPAAAQIAWPTYSLKRWATEVTNPEVSKWIPAWNKKQPNIIMSDFYEESDIVGKIIESNF